jgi:hypothetical protein
VPVVPVLPGANINTDVSAEELAGTDFIQGEPETVSLGPIQQLPSLTVDESISVDPDRLSPYQFSPDPEQPPDPDLTNFASAASSRQHQK